MLGKRRALMHDHTARERERERERERARWLFTLTVFNAAATSICKKSHHFLSFFVYISSTMTSSSDINSESHVWLPSFFNLHILLRLSILLLTGSRVLPSACVVTCGQCVDQIFARLLSVDNHLLPTTIDVHMDRDILQGNRSQTMEMTFNLGISEACHRSPITGRDIGVYQAAVKTVMGARSCLKFNEIKKIRLQTKSEVSVAAYAIFVKMECSGEVQLLAVHLPSSDRKANSAVQQPSTAKPQLPVQVLPQQTCDPNTSSIFSRETQTSRSFAKQSTTPCVQELHVLTSTGEHWSAGVAMAAGHSLLLLHSDWQPMQLNLVPEHSAEPVSMCRGNWWQFDLKEKSQDNDKMASNCLHIEQVHGIYLQAASNDAWQIRSPAVLVRLADKSVRLLTADLHSTMWLDNDSLDASRSMHRLTPSDPCVVKLFKRSSQRKFDCPITAVGLQSSSTKVQHLAVPVMFLFAVSNLVVYSFFSWSDKTGRRIAKRIFKTFRAWIM